MDDTSLRFGPVELRPRERRLLVEGRVQALGARAFDLLVALVECRERVVTKRELLERVWPETVVEESNLPVQVSALRKILGAAAIATIPGRGYRFTLTTAAASSVSPASPASSAGPAGRFDQVVDLEPLIGREEAVYEVVETLLERRLVNIVGAGGIGKTRLARAVQRRLREDFVDGVWWVDLAPLGQPEHVPRAIAQALGEPFDVGVAAGELPNALARSLAHRQRMLLVLDNCEQVAAGVVRVVRALLVELPRLRLLLTSRVPMHLPAEQVWRLEALAVPQVGDALEQARRCSAFEMLEHCVHANHQRFVIDAEQLPAAIELCRRLEGHPLAIEMAAARVPQLGLVALLGLLGDRLRLLRASDPTQPDRQVDLRALLNWSCSQLDGPQRAVLRRLSVFAGSFGLDAAQRVAADGPLDEWDVLDALSVLVDHSLVQAHLPTGSVWPGSEGRVHGPAPPRYRLPETTRLYALEQLAAAGEEPLVRGRLRLAMARLADEAADAWWSLTQASWLRRFAADRDDLQAVFDTACTQGDAGVAARTGQALQALDGALGTAVAAGKRAGAARMLLPGSDGGRTTALLWNLVAPTTSPEQPMEATPEDAEARVQAWRRAGDARELYLAQRDLALAAARAGRDHEALAAADAMRALEDPDWGPALRCEGAQVHAGLDAPCRTDARYRGLSRDLSRGLELAERTGDAWRVAWLRFQLAALITAEGPPDFAVHWGEQATAALERLHRPIVLGWAWSNLCAAQLFTGADAAARLSAAEGFAILHSAGRGTVLFPHLALIEARRNNVERACRLLALHRSAAPDSVPRGGQAISARLWRLAGEAIGSKCGGLPEFPVEDEPADELAWAALGGREAVLSRRCVMANVPPLF